MILIYPPVTKPCEPPSGIAKLAGVLRNNKIECKTIDANLEGLLSLLEQKSRFDFSDNDTWTKISQKHSSDHIDLLRNNEEYRHQGKYIRAIKNISRLLQKVDNDQHLLITLSNYQDSRFSPLKSADLINAASLPEQNPFYFYFKTRLTNALKENSSNYIGFSINFLGQAVCAFAMIGFLKKICPNVKIIAGGGLITSWMSKQSWNGENLFKGLIDHFVKGPGENFLLSLFEKKYDFQHSLPDYDDFKLSDYISPGFILPYSASYGCYWKKCSFCPEKSERSVYCHVPADQSSEQLKYLVSRYKPVLVHFLDNALSPKLFKSLITNPPNVSWYGFTRVTPHLADPDFCKQLKKSGCVMLKLGIESGDNTVLRSMQKGVDTLLSSQVLTALNKAGIATYVYLLFGTPFENQESARQTLRFTIDNSESIGFLNLAIFNLPSNSPEAESLKTYSFYDGDLSLYKGFEHPVGWNRNNIRNFLQKEFKKHPAVSRIIQRDPLVFTSNHAPFFVGLG